MGKKPVLGLVGLCLGLALTGCKNCDCGHASRRSERAAVARQKKAGGKTEEVMEASSQDRQRSIPNTAPTATSSATPQDRFDFPAHNYNVPGAAVASEDVKTVARSPKPAPSQVKPSEAGAIKPPSDVVPAARVENPDSAMHDLPGHKGVSKDEAAAGLTQEPLDVHEITADSAKKPMPAKEATPKMPGGLPSDLDLPAPPKKPAATEVTPIPPGPPLESPMATPVKSMKKTEETTPIPAVPSVDIPPPPAMPSPGVKQAVPAAPVAKPEVPVTETKTVLPEAPEPDLSVPMEVKSGPEVVPPVVLPPAMPSTPEPN